MSSRWQPTDAEGRITYAQVAAHNDALRRFGPTVDWMVFMDMDEFLVSDQPIPEMARKLEAGGYDGGIMYDRAMTSRFDHLDRYVTETTMTFRDPFWSCAQVPLQGQQNVVRHGGPIRIARAEVRLQQARSCSPSTTSSRAAIPTSVTTSRRGDKGIPPEWLEEQYGRLAARTATRSGS